MAGCSGGGPERGGKKWTWIALVLEEIREYDTVKMPERFAPVGGRYLRE